MRYLKIMTLLILGIGIFGIKYANAVNAVDEADERDNYFCPIDGKLSFEQGSDSDWYTITKDQPFDGVVQGTGKYKNCIDVKAGRKNDKNNNLWLNTKLTELGLPIGDPDSVTCTTYDENKCKDLKLNFAVIGTLVYTGLSTVKCPNVIIGQLGSDSSLDNLWMVENNISNFYPHTLVCKDGNNNPASVQLFYTSNKHYIMTFSPL